MIELHGDDAFPIYCKTLTQGGVKVLWVSVDNEYITIPTKHIPEFKKYLVDFMDSKCPK